jgi:hypothetical protein
MHSDIMNLVVPPTLSAELVSVPMASKNPRGYELQDIAFIDPHVAFSRFHEDNHLWKQFLAPSDDALEEFWNGQLRAESPRLQNHPMMSVPNWKRIFVPLFLHGDGVPVVGVGKSWGKSMDSYNWGSILAQGTTKMVNFLICAVFHVCLVQGMAVPHGGTMTLV